MVHVLLLLPPTSRWLLPCTNFTGFHVVCSLLQFPNLLGQALPTSSKFFFTYIIMRTLLSVPLRFLITQPGVWQCWLR